VPRSFTLEEANALIPRVTTILARTTQLVGRVRAISRRLAEAGVRSSKPGGLPEDADLSGHPELVEDLARARLLVETADDEARRLLELGIVIRDLERGLLDFHSILDGQRPVFLCWQLGEREIRHYHELSSGFVDRRPIEGHRFFRTRQLVPPRSSE
jgi:hypothetical protein